jgi:hypothetical protein
MTDLKFKIDCFYYCWTLRHVSKCMKNIIVHLTLTTILFISGTFENNVLCLLQPYIIAFECLLHIFDAAWYRCKVVISSIMLCFFDWTMWYFLRHRILAHLAKGNMSYYHHLVRSPSSSSVCCYCNILMLFSETPWWIKLKIWTEISLLKELY